MFLHLRVSIVNSSWNCVLALLLCFGFFVSENSADQLILDESLVNYQSVGDFDVVSCILPVEPELDGLLDENGEISAGDLYRYFDRKGMESVNEIVFCVDVDPTIGGRTDYSLESLVLSIEDIEKYTLGENSLMLPAYEASTMKPEAQLSIKLDYDFMKRFNENSKERIKFDFAVAGQQSKSMFKIGVLPESQSNFDFSSRFLFLSAFVGFWLVVFFVLFRATNPKTTTDMASPA